MSALEVERARPSLVPSIPAAPPPRQGTGKFFGSERAFFGLLARGAVFLMLTLGIYRFWLTTDVRRFLWGNTEIAGDGLEYTGTARELLIGFLMAIVFLLPINGLIFIGTLAPTLLPYSGTLGFVLLALLGQFAFFRARRYRLTRTVYRGVRFHQTGSAVRYSVRANLWMVLIGLTAGLAYPWAAASLERYKMRHTHFGDLSGQFVGSGTSLFLRGFLLWLIVIGPPAAGVFQALASINWPAVVTALESGSWAQLVDASAEFAGALAVLVGGLTWALLAAVLLYPLFRAIVLRWWLSGLRVGAVAMTSRLRTGQIYAVYARFLWYALLFLIAVSIVGSAGVAIFAAASKSIAAPAATEIAAVVLGLAGYVVVMLGYSTLYQATVSIRLWRLSFETTALAGLEALDSVQARGERSGPFGEGLADALDVGGM
ncbi:MAG TPA: DUF898 family protein [Xanthobacteraceae bacterium]|nr:DUF898 family protein [Xanthobacteraceae bacterium]